MRPLAAPNTPAPSSATRAAVRDVFGPPPGGVRKALAALPPGLDREIASSRETEYLGGSSLLREELHPSRILRDHSEPHHRTGELYNHMLEVDTDLAGFWEKLVGSVLQLPRLILPADGSPLAAETATFCRDALALVNDLAANLAHQCEAEITGLAIDELMWERVTRGPLTRALVPVAIVDRPMWRFAFRDGALHVRRRGGLELTPAPPYKFLVARRGTKDSPWGYALLDRIFGAWWYKRHAVKFYATFLDKWAQPLALGKYKHRASAAKNDEADKTNAANQALLLEAIELIQTEYGVVLPEGLNIELLEAQRSGSASYESFVALMTRAEALFLLGEIDTSGAAKGPGSFAKSQVSDGVRLERVRRVAHNAAADLQSQLLRYLVELNFGLGAPVPRWQVDTLEAEDREQRRLGIELVLNAGEPVPRRHLYQTAQVPEPTEGEPVIRRAARAASPSPAPGQPTGQPGTPAPTPAPTAPPSPQEPADA